MGSEMNVLDAERARLDAMAAVLFFLAGAARDGAMCQGRTARDAFNAACCLLGVSDADRAEIERCVV